MAPYVGVIGRGGIVARGHGGGFRAEADVRTGRSRRGARHPVLPIRGRPVEEQVPTIITIAPALAQHLRVMAPCRRRTQSGLLPSLLPQEEDCLPPQPTAGRL